MYLVMEEEWRVSNAGEMRSCDHETSVDVETADEEESECDSTERDMDKAGPKKGEAWLEQWFAGSSLVSTRRRKQLSPGHQNNAQTSEGHTAKLKSATPKTLFASSPATYLLDKSSANKRKRTASLFATSPTTLLCADADSVPRQLGDNLWIRDSITGLGEPCKQGDLVSVCYCGRLDATKRRFDHVSNPQQPFSFVIGDGTVVIGFDRGVQGMRLGGVREIVVPPHFAYGAQGQPPCIPPDATLHYVVNLINKGAADFGENEEEDQEQKRTQRRRPRGTRGGHRVNKRRHARLDT